MTCLKFILFALLFTPKGAFSQKLIQNRTNQKLHKLVESKDFFALKEEYTRNQSKLSEARKLYYEVYLSQVFGRNEKSNQSIAILFEKYPDQFNELETLNLLEAQANNFLHYYEYQQAASIYGSVLTNYSQLLDSASIESYQNVKNLFGSLAAVPPQKMHKSKEVLLPSYRNAFNHMMTPVTVNGIQEEFIFDTGANLSTITESQAVKMQLKLIDQSVAIASSTQNVVQSKLAVADSLWIGDILFENVVFIVMPDAQLTFPEINYAIKGIIGFPVMDQMGEVHLLKNGNIFIPKEVANKQEQNMFFEGLTPVVRLHSKKNTLLFTFDTGARTSELSIKYYKAHKIEVKRKGEMQKNQRGGAGGNVEVNEYMLFNFPMTIGAHQLSLEKIPVTMEEYWFNAYFDGNLGQDVFMKFNSLIINFEHMYIDFE
jgi:predicted aspartyl protease